MIFCEVIGLAAQNVKATLENYCSASRQLVNYENRGPNSQRGLRKGILFALWVLCRYLHQAGILTAKEREQILWIKKKISCKLASWKVRILS